MDGHIPLGDSDNAIAMKEEVLPYMSFKAISLYIMFLNLSIFITVPREILKPRGPHEDIFTK